MAIGDSLADPNLWVDSTTAFNDAISGGTPRFISLPLRAGVDYFFAATSGAFDAFLTLYDTLDNAQAVLLTDDNSLGGTDPLIATFVCPVTGIYYLGVSTLDNDGAFSFLSADNLTAGALFYFRTKITNMVGSFLQNRIIKITNQIGLFNVIKRKLVTNQFNIFDVHKLQITNQFNLHSITKVSSGGGGEFHVWSKVGYEIFANGVLIGFLAEGVFTLTDVALVDGDYEIVAKPLGNFYREVEVRQMLRINTDMGGAGVTELFPLINDLVMAIDNARTYLAWNILPQYVANTTKIGLWFGATSGIVITGVPDVSININELLTFRYSFLQVVNQWVAVAAYDGADRGTKSEIELVWSTALPDAPEFQHIEE